MSKKTLRDLILNQPVKITPFTYLGNTFFSKELDVGTMNFIQRRLREIKKELAEKQDIYLSEDDPDQYDDALRRVYDEFEVARLMAFRLSDEEGTLLFDAESEDDLCALNRLGQSFADAVFTAGQDNSVKNSETGAVSR